MNVSEYLIFRHTISEIRYPPKIGYGEQISEPEIETIESILSNNMMKMSNFSCFVSGGLDSSLLAAISRPPVIYCATFPDSPFDEGHWAKIVAKHIGASYCSVEIKKEEYLATLEFLMRTKQDGLHPNEPCLFIVAKKAKQAGFNMMISGEGADDIFGGYSDLLEHEKEYMKDKETFLNRYAYMRPSLVNLPEDIPFEKFKEWGMEQFILRIHTPGLISRARNACYAAGMDVKFPYMEGDLAQYMWNCKRKFKKEKNTLKKLAEKYLPREIIDREKIGFPVPLDEWLGEKGIQKFLLLNANIWRSIQ